MNFEGGKRRIMIRKGMIGAVMLGAAVAISGGVATAGYIQGTHVKTDLPGPFHITMSPDGST
ncbi:MAG: hypothetical protein K8F34_07010, partial [Candidatus Kuenenia stuttgartiensis]|nr:hypothetical protein [Candidatus Kuenenia stuttgartiensis]